MRAFSLELGVLKDNKLYIAKTEMKFTSKTLLKLGYFGLKSEVQKDDTLFWSEEYTDMIPAWKLLSSISLESNKNPILIFSHCMFDSTYPYSKDIFEALIDNNAALNLLDEFFIKNGYKYIDTRENELSMDWVKNYGKKEEHLKDSCLEREHGGISIWYDYKKKNQIFLGLRIPKYKELLLNFDEMDNQLKEFVIAKAKRCNDCGYCTQTDKTGTRKKQLINVTHNGEYNLCLLFPGYSYIWTHIDSEIAANIIKFLSFTDMVLQKK